MELKQVIIMRTDLKMNKGKLAAQAAHASLEAYLKTLHEEPGYTEEWLSHGAQKVVLKVNSEKELLELFESLRHKFPCSLIRDAGRTQIAPGSITALGIGPDDEKELDKFTGKLKLL